MSEFTYAYVLDRVKERFPRTDSVLEAMLADDIFKNHIRAICSKYPYWFLEVPPGYTFPTQFPITEAALTAYSPVVGSWLDRGWLRVQPNISRYLIAAPADFGTDFDTDVAYWSYTEIQKVNFIQEFSLSGEPVMDLEAVGGNRYASRVSYAATGRPLQVCWETGVHTDGKRVSWLRFNPTPKSYGIYQVKFTLKAPIQYEVSSGVYTNRMLEEYPEVVIAAGMIEAAKYYNEEKAIMYYNTELYGSPNDGRKGFRGKQTEGKIAEMKRDSRRAETQDVQEMPIHLGVNGAVPRSGARRRSRRGLYWQD